MHSIFVLLAFSSSANSVTSKPVLFQYKSNVAKG